MLYLKNDGVTVTTVCMSKTSLWEWEGQKKNQQITVRNYKKNTTIQNTENAFKLEKWGKKRGKNKTSKS